MTKEIKVLAKKQIFFEAEPKQSIWFWPSYAEPEGKRMIGALTLKRHGPVKDSIFTEKHYYEELIQIVSSNDNGASWEKGEILWDDRSGYNGAKEFYIPIYILDPNNGLLLELRGISLVNSCEGTHQFMGAMNLGARTYRMFYRFSADGARSWSRLKQVIHTGSEFDSENWLPGITYGFNSASYGMPRFAVNGDGEIVLPINKFTTFDNKRDTKYTDHGVSIIAGFLRGKWKEDLSDIEWRASEEYMDAPDRPSGPCEADIISLGGNTLFSTFRSKGSKKISVPVPSVRMCSFSKDGGKTWGKLIPLIYDDGETVWAAASPSEFIQSPNTGKIYWVANIQNEPVYSAYPRSPLSIAEFDPEKQCLIRATVSHFWKKPEEMDPSDRRYSNFGCYLDRETGEFVFTMSEQWKISREDYTADAIGIRIKLQED
ncbi:MAG: sialidase family protein [bacterium]|nr:sialidase family protein [bacterium]